MQSVLTFQPDIVRVRLGGRVGGGVGQRTSEGWGVPAAATICMLTESGKDPLHLQFPLVRHLFRPPVATCGSCFQTCQAISSKKNHIKEEFPLKCLKQLWNETIPRLYIFFYFLVPNDSLSNLSSNYCEHYVNCQPRGIDVKVELL